jgi:hypothetical protein
LGECTSMAPPPRIVAVPLNVIPLELF